MIPFTYNNILMKFPFYIFFFLLFSSENDIRCQTLSECIMSNALYYVGTPYVAGTLDQNEAEKLICRSDAFDCVTFVEYILALSLYQVKKTHWNTSLEANVQKLRYRQGEINGYLSRIHYFSEWIQQNTQWPFLNEISQKLGGKPHKKTINFMTNNATKYPLLKSDKDIIKMADYEKSISQDSFYYIPKERVLSIQHQLKDGDIIAITTDIGGLDIVHTGFIKISNGKAHLLHASQSSGKVEVSTLPLDKYLSKNKNQNGIRVIRAL